MKKNILVILAVGLILTGQSSLAWAHRVNVFAYEENGKLLGESYFPGGKKAIGAEVQLLDSAGKMLASTRTGPKGNFSFPLPTGAGPHTVVINAGQGHRGEFIVEPVSNQAPGSSPAAEPAKAAVISGLDKKELTEAINIALDQKLTPLKARLDRLIKQSEAVTIKGVVGGLGWIMGLIGLAAYFISRKKPLQEK